MCFFFIPDTFTIITICSSENFIASVFCFIYGKYLVPIKRPWLSGQCVRLLISRSRSQVGISAIADFFLLIRGLFLVFLIPFPGTASCRILATSCFACVKIQILIFLAFTCKFYPIFRMKNML